MQQTPTTRLASIHRLGFSCSGGGNLFAPSILGDVAMPCGQHVRRMNASKVKWHLPASSETGSSRQLPQLTSHHQIDRKRRFNGKHERNFASLPSPVYTDAFWPTVLSVEPLVHCVVCLSVCLSSVCDVLYCGDTVRPSKQEPRLLPRNRATALCQLKC